MKKLSKFQIPPPADRASLGVLSTPQLRVLRVLATAKGAISRTEISRRTGNKTGVMVGRAVGYTDPFKRKAFENSKDGGFRPSLLTLGYVTETELDIEDVIETVIEITPMGRKAAEQAAHMVLPAIHEDDEED